MAQGSGGAFEVSQRMTALLGWGGTTKFAEAWWVGGEMVISDGCSGIIAGKF